MASSINPLFPLTTNATTQSVRDNFAFAKSEIEALQLGSASFIASGTGAVFRTTQEKERDIVHIKDFGAICDGVADDTASVIACEAANTNRTIYYSGTPRLTSKVTLSRKNNWIGQGGMGTSLTDLPGSYFIKAASMTTAAIEITEDGSVMEYGGVIGEVGNTGDNIVVWGNSSTLRSVTSARSGRDGFRQGLDTAGANTNGSVFDHCQSFSNVRRGFYVNSFEPNANACEYRSCVARLNGEDGMLADNCDYVTITNFLGEANTGRGLHLGANAKRVFVFGGDREANVSTQLLVDAGATGIVLCGNFSEVVDNTVGGCIRLDRMFQKQGTFVPSFAGSSTPGTQTYSDRTGTQFRIGDMMFGTVRITLSAKDAATAGNMEITGLPFVYPAGFTNGNIGCSIGQWGGITFPANYTQLCAEIFPSESRIRLLRGGSGQTAAFVAASEAGNASQILLSFWYPINQF